MSDSSSRGGSARSIERPTPFDGSLQSLTNWLRWADVHFHISVTFGTIGAALVILGAVSGVISIFRAYPWLLAVASGLICLIVSAMSYHRGLVRLLPLSLQQLLLERTPFDVLFDESELQHSVRRWGRVLLLGQARSAQDVQTILHGLDANFLDLVFRRGAVHMLPPGVRCLLLPELMQPEAPSVKQILPTADNRHLCWWNSGMATLVARCSRAKNHSAGATPAELTPFGIRQMIRHKVDKKKSMERLESLAPVVLHLFKPSSIEMMMPSAMREAVQRGFHFAALVAAGASAMWVTSACFFCTPLARIPLQCALSTIGRAAIEDTRERSVNRAAFVGSGVSLLGAGASLALSLYIQRQWLTKATGLGETYMSQSVQAKRRSVGRCGIQEPDSEESPENSSFEEEEELRNICCR